MVAIHRVACFPCGVNSQRSEIAAMVQVGVDCPPGMVPSKRLMRCFRPVFSSASLSTF